MISDGTIYLRAPEPTDVDAMFRWENERSSWSSAGVRAPMSRHMIWKYVEEYTADLAADGQARFIICLQDTDTPVGAIDLYDADITNRRCGVGIAVDPAFRGSGYGSRALTLLADYAWRDLGFHQLWATVSSENTASRRLFADCGFAVSGRLRSWIRQGDSFTDAFIYQRLLPVSADRG